MTSLEGSMIETMNNCTLNRLSMDGHTFVMAEADVSRIAMDGYKF